jgi:uncharacterized protein
MSVAGEAQEPTMEEILASIRKIISDDEPAAEKPEPAKPVVRAVEPEPDDIFEEGLEAVELVDEKPQAAPLDFDDIDDDDEVLELTDIVSAKPVVEKPVETLLSETAAQITAESFSHLSGLMVRGYAGSENTLEGLVRDMLRPMLKQWLDANLPEMVEGMVAREIERISGRDQR